VINVTKTFLPPKEKLFEYINRIYESGWITNNGALVNELEKQLCSFLGVENLVLVTNGTLALQVAYKVLGLKGEVITTPFSFVATTSSLVWENLKPIFADIDVGSFNIDPASIKTSINKNTSAVLPVHVFGNPCDVVEIEKICINNGIKLIFDAAHAFGVNFMDQSILKYGDASVLSFHATKIFHTIEGGAIIFKERKHYEEAKIMINFGISDYDTVGNLGINCKMNEFQAAMGLSVLEGFLPAMSERKVVWTNYLDAFRNSKTVELQKITIGSNQNYSYFPIVMKNEEVLKNVVANMKKEEFFPRRYFYPSLNTLNYIAEYQPCKISESLASRILCLPVYPGLEKKYQDRIVEIINKNTI
jgi:dTDP-4-amino-4,6-dideoxygalactose transaminase